MRLKLSRNVREWLVVLATAVIVLGILGWATASRGNVQWNFLAGFLIVVVIYSIFALGLSLEFGQTGLLNFGHVAFMLIGAYTYGILMMRPQDRPREAAGFVGAMYDAAPRLEGASVWGALACLLAALLVGALVAVPVLVGLSRLTRAVPAKVGLGVGLGAGVVVAAIVFLALFPLSAPGALNAATLLAMLLGVVLAALAGLLLGLPTVRLREDYLAIVTIASAEILRSVTVNEEAWTRGTRNIVNFPRPLIDWSLATGWWDDIAEVAEVRPASLALLVVGGITLAVVFLVLQTLARSPWGRVLQAIREDEDAAASLGKNVFWYKLQSLMLGSAVAAVAGILLVTYLANISPTHFLPLITFYAYIVVVVGGMGNHKGVLVGALILWGLFSIAQIPQFARIGLAAGPPQAIFIGVVLILVMMFRPQGLLGRKEELLFAK